MNPIGWKNNSYKYEGRRLTRYTCSSGYYEYSYDENGLRILKKKNTGETTDFYYSGTNLVVEQGSNYRLDFLYDENRQLYGVIKDNASKYFYIKDCLGTILGIVNESGTLVAKYTYTAFGKCTVALNNDGIATMNPFRFKGYYLDSESGMYYCHTRYYVPEWGRWLDANLVVHQSSLNAFAYCKNNPIWKGVFNRNSSCFGSGEKIARETIGFQQVSNTTGTTWKAFGYEHRTSAGWEADGRMLTSSVLRIGFSSYVTHSTADRPSVFYAFTGLVESDSLSFLGETWYAGIGMNFGNVFGWEIQVETLGIASNVHIGNLNIAVDLNLLGAVSITIGVDKDLGNGCTSTTGITIGVNFLLLAYVVLAICSLVQPSSVPAGQPSGPVYQPAV